jgi:glycosyltransferase involved in cell wall biosynthesis
MSATATAARRFRTVHLLWSLITRRFTNHSPIFPRETLFSALHSSPTAVSGASRQKPSPGCQPKKPKMNKVSIIIPLHNAEPYVEDAIKSAINQTWPNKEIVVVDDGSTDGSLAVAKKMESEMVRIFQIPPTTASAARNFGISKTTGEYIQFLDADDILAPDKIGRQMSQLVSNPGEYISSCPWVKFKKDTSEASFSGQDLWRETDAIEWLVKAWSGGGMMHSVCWLIPRSILRLSGIWNEELSLHDDGEFFCRVMLHSKGMLFCDQAIVYYRVTPNSLSKRRSYMAAQSALKTYTLYKEHVLPQRDDSIVRRALANNFLQFLYEFHPNYPDLLEVAEIEIKNLGFSNIPIYECGGGLFLRVSKMFGFKNALALRKLLSR